MLRHARIKQAVTDSLHTCSQRVGDLKVEITSQGYPTPTFSVYRMENQNLPTIKIREK